MNWLKKIGNKGSHNAFTDLCEFNASLFCCYREAKNHISSDGSIRVISTDFTGNLISSLRIFLPVTDLRDPKLSITPNGNLMLIAYARLINADNKTLSTRNLCWISQTGKSWSSPSELADKGWWLWRLKWHEGLAYGFAYNKSANAINLYKGDPQRSFHLHQQSALSLVKHNKGYPNESDIIFNKNTAFAIVRRDADSYSAQLGVSLFPYKQWQWTDLKIYIGGPAMLLITDNLALVAGRIIQGKKLVTGLLLLDLKSAHLTLLKVLPSSGDNSYPGLVLKNNLLYMSYYSSHEDQKSSVYLTEININELNIENLANKVK